VLPKDFHGIVQQGGLIYPCQDLSDQLYEIDQKYDFISNHTKYIVLDCIF
jgi:hypothetical protein